MRPVNPFRIAASINRMRVRVQHPQAQELLKLLAQDISRSFPEEDKKEFMDRCTRGIQT